MADGQGEEKALVVAAGASGTAARPRGRAKRCYKAGGACPIMHTLLTWNPQGTAMAHFDGKPAAITGAGAGIGRALALVLNRQSCERRLCDVDRATA